MPVTVRPSKQFYDKFGEQETNELVTWFNEIGSDSRAELRELNDRNMLRIDAKFDELKLDIADRFTAHARWMMSGWAIVMGTMIALWLRK